MRRQALKARADWNVVLEADAAAADSIGWKNLMILVGRSMPDIERELSRSDKTLMLVNSDRLLRYGRIDLLERLRERVWSASSGLYGIWMLIKSDELKPASSLDIDAALSIFRNQLTAIPECWITKDR